VNETAWTPIGVALAWGSTLAVAAYALMRAGQALSSPEVELLQAAPSAHIGFFWRSLNAAYLGGIGAFVAAAMARARPEATARALGPALVASACLLAAQALVWP
jgi:hypothetical protein